MTTGSTTSSTGRSGAKPRGFTFCSRHPMPQSAGAGYKLVAPMQSGERELTKSEILRVQAYLRDKFQMPAITLHQRAKKEDSAEVTIGDEFIGVVFREIGRAQV